MAGKDANPEYRRIYENVKWPLFLYTVLAALYTAYLPGKFVWFSWHPLAMVVSFIGLALNGALLKKIGGYDNTVNHGKLMNLGVVVGLFGWYVIYSNKELYGKPHLTTPHAKLGVVVMLGYLGLGAVGLLALHPDFGFLKTNKTVRFAHKWAGRAMTLLAWLVCVLGKLPLFSPLMPLTDPLISSRLREDATGALEATGFRSTFTGGWLLPPHLAALLLLLISSYPLESFLC